MATSSIISPTNALTTVAANSSTPTSSTSSSDSTASALGIDQQTIAGNFQTFLTLLTTQLQNQNPLDPLDTNQFTQQLVQFAQVEQQLRSNDQLGTLISLQQTAQTTAALGFVGQTVVVDGATAQLSNGQANWNFNSPKPATANIVIKDASGQTAYTGSYSVQAGPQAFAWDGKGNDGKQWPDGPYTMSITSQDATGQSVAIATTVQGIVDSVDLTQNPPLLSIGGSNYTINQIKQIIRSTQ